MSIGIDFETDQKAFPEASLKLVELYLAVGEGGVFVGKGIDTARAAGAGLHADVLDDFKDQLLIVFLKRLKNLGHDLRFPVAEVDDTYQDTVAFSVIDGVFCFELRRKS